MSFQCFYCQNGLSVTFLHYLQQLFDIFDKAFLLEFIDFLSSHILLAISIIDVLNLFSIQIFSKILFTRLLYRNP